ncbi:MAG: hypothetical protein KY445_15980, partial [Armatimonadetes bacterium]|nr:hypothetical protein [Armatimonadota bacterium]
FAGRGQSVNQIRRGDAVVWEKPFTVPPGVGEMHQDWFYVRLERRQTSAGVRFRWSVNGRELTDYLDPNPLADGGHLGFWTQNGALSIARVRLWHSGLRAQQDRAPIVARTASPEPPNVLGKWSARGEGQGASARLISVSQTAGSGQKTALQITNPRSGGDWTTFVTRTPFDLAAHPIVQWDYRVPQGVKINLYALIDDVWREIVFNGGASDGAASLGTVGGVQSDGQWRRARFDLAGAIRENGLESKEVQALAFAAPDRDYLRSGLGGNRRGATYWLRDLKAGTF